MAKKKKPLPLYTGPLFAVGQFVKINRPAITWSGCAGAVEDVDEKTGVHRIRVTSRDGVDYSSSFPVEELGVNLEIVDLLG